MVPVRAYGRIVIVKPQLTDSLDNFCLCTTLCTAILFPIT